MAVYFGKIKKNSIKTSCSQVGCLAKRGKEAARKRHGQKELVFDWQCFA
ncbi:MAG: hypothetical protein AAGI90_06610 [Chlamydiota bacterium]